MLVHACVCSKATEASLNWVAWAWPTFPWSVNAASGASLPVEGALQSYLIQKPNIHKHGDIPSGQDAVLCSLFVVFNSSLGRWIKFVDPSSSPGAALHAAAKQRLFHNRSKRGFSRRRWRRRRGSSAASGRSQCRWRRVGLGCLSAASKPPEH